MNQDQAKRCGRDMVMFGHIEDYDIETLVSVLQHADDMYYNGNGSFLADNDYDAIRRYAYYQAPDHSYFIGIGSEVRGGKVSLPYTMGSLDQVNDADDVERWVKQHNVSQSDVIITEKLDGTSALVIYNHQGKLQIAHSRGDGKRGADITRHIKHIVPNQIKNTGKRLAIRGEVIIPMNVFPKLRSSVSTRAGEQYKNPRNMVAGLMNAEKNDDSVYQHIDFVAYDVINRSMDKDFQMEFLEKVGLNTPLWIQAAGKDLLAEQLHKHDLLTNTLNKMRDQSPYEIDGIVIDINDAHTRDRLAPTNDDLNPKYSVKYKVADASNLTEAKVVDVLWKPSKHGYLKPRVKIEPVELAGVTVQHATGFNAKFINDNGIGPSAVVKITRSGEVIPFILETITSTQPKMPNAEWEWNETNVDAVLIDCDDDTVTVNRLTDFFSTIEAPHLKKGNVQKLYDAGYQTPEDIITMHESEMIDIFGHANGIKIYQGLFDTLNGIELYKLIGAHSTSRGIGVRKIKKLQEAVGMYRLLGQDVESCRGNYLDCSEINQIDGFDVKTSQKVVHELDQFTAFWSKVKHNVVLASEQSTNNTGGSMVGEKIVFTGFRDAQLAEQVEAEGGEIQNSASGKTTIVVAADPNKSSGKIQKARDAGAKIVSIEQFKEML